jgi:hypothetical protein
VSVPTYQIATYMQPLLVLSAPTETAPDENTYEFVSTPVQPGVIAFLAPVTSEQTFIPATTFADVPVVWEQELSSDYAELGEALREMTEVGDDDDWHINPDVYGSALFVAASLRETAVPAPRVFTHGPESVVFNWSHLGDNLYLTISADRMSALLSTPEKIVRRVDCSRLLSAGSSAAAVLSFAQNKPVQRALLPTATDSVESVG